MKILYKQNTYSIQNLLDLIVEEDIVIPSFQRNIVWKTRDKIEFIESILIGIPIPSLYFATYKKLTDESMEQYLIIDGLQRINALKEFILENKFKLVSKSPDWKNKKFTDLAEKYQKKIKRTFINAISIIQSETDHFMLFHVFARINKGGTRLSHQQIRNSVYRSIFIQKIQEYSISIVKNLNFTIKDNWKKMILFQKWYFEYW